jgi:hypothetical protein
MLPAVDASSTIRVDELRAALDAVLARVQERFGNEIALGADHYWEVGIAAAFDLQSVPVAEAGQLTEDVERIRELLKDGSTADVWIWHDVGHLVGVLRRVAALDLPAHHTGAE